MLRIRKFSDVRDDVLKMFRREGPQPLMTGITALDPYYKIMPATLHVVTGIPNHGKSTFLEQIIVMMSANHGWKFAIFSPEHSQVQYTVRLLQQYINKPFDDTQPYHMTEEDIVEGTKWLDDRFFFIENNTMPSVQELLLEVEELHKQVGINGLVIDPWNEVSANRPTQQSETEYISQSLSQMKVFNKRHGITTWVVAHPTKPQKDKEGKVIKPDLYSISGSAHFYNKMDYGIIIYRDWEKNRTTVSIAKVKEQTLWGQPGEVEFIFCSRMMAYKIAPPERQDKEYENFRDLA